MLKDKVAWVTGASRGIGRATAIECARQGARVIISARSVAGLAETGSAIGPFGVEPLVLPMDVTLTDSVKVAFREVHSKFGRIDVLVNNAGILRDALLGMITEDQMDDVFHTNIYSVIRLTQYAARMMSRQKSGSIVNVASIIGKTGNEGQVVYGASKAAVIGATKSAARELAPYNVRVNAVAPGVIQTDMIRGIPDSKMQQLRADIKMKRLGSPEEVAKVIVFLASDMASYVTGQIVGVDGGMWI